MISSRRLLYTMLQVGQSSGSGLKKKKHVLPIVTTFAFPAMNNKEDETGHKFSKDQTLEKMYVHVLMECIRYKQ